MSPVTRDTHIASIRPILTPEELLAKLPLTEGDSTIVAETRQEISQMLHSEATQKLLIIVGPCSIHDTKAALEYAEFIQKMREKYSETLLIVMRTYFEKPRTTIGWKGLINDPCLDGSCDINTGLHMGRELLVQITHMGVPIAVEFLDTISPQYLADLVSWGCIGARTAESQVHRELASGLSCPIGIKNSTDGSIKIALDAMESAAYPHEFLSVDQAGRVAIVKTRGNDDTHIILRGSSTGPNYSPEDVKKIEEAGEKRGKKIRIMIDCSHGNSCKDFRRQMEVCKSIASQVTAGSQSIMGVMIESNLVEGAQSLKDPKNLVYGQSITDGCVGLETTEAMLEMLSGAIMKKNKNS